MPCPCCGPKISVRRISGSRVPRKSSSRSFFLLGRHITQVSILWVRCQRNVTRERVAPLGCGTVFKLNTSGHETVLHNFTYSNGEGVNPFAALIMDKEGNLFGTTYYGGASGQGTVFKLDTSGNLTLLHSFVDPFLSIDGAAPIGGYTFNPGAFQVLAELSVVTPT